MTVFRPPLGLPASERALLPTVVAFGLVATVVLSLGLLGTAPSHGASGAPSGTDASARDTLLVHPGVVSSIGEVGAAPSEAVVGSPVAFAWQALDPSGARVTTFAVACELTVALSSNGSSVHAWVNTSATGPIVRSANGTFSLPAAAWNAGVLNLTVSVASAVPVSVRLFGAFLPALPPRS